jgi:hypothetical protein
MFWGGNPGNSDDCVDLAHKTTPTGVEIKSVVREIASELYVCKYLACEFLRHFPEQDMGYEEPYGGSFPMNRANGKCAMSITQTWGLLI